jgi:transcriptional regulator with XRE-family HTH domain
MTERDTPEPPDKQRTARLGAVLHRLMRRANLTGNELARRAGVSPATITNLLRGTDVHGKPTFPTPDILKAVAWGLGSNGLGEHDIDAADRAYAELMQAIGYLDAPSLVYAPPLPQEVLDLLANNPDLTIELGHLSTGWRPGDTKLLIERIARFRAESVHGNDEPECQVQ